MQRAFEKIIERLEETDFNDIQMVVRETLKKYGFPYESVVQDEVWDTLDGLSTNKFAIEIVNQVASEYGGGWIPVSSGKLPEVPEGKDYVDVLITKQYTSSAEVIPTEYYEEDGFNDYEKSLITAWRYDYIPEPYKAESEQLNQNLGE